MNISLEESDFMNKSCVEIFDGLMDKCNNDEDHALRLISDYQAQNDGYNEELEKAKEALFLIKKTKTEASLKKECGLLLQEVNRYAVEPTNASLEKDLYKIEKRFLPALDDKVLVNNLSYIDSDFVLINFKKAHSTEEEDEIIARPFGRKYDKEEQRQKFYPLDIDEEGNRNLDLDYVLDIEEVLDLLRAPENYKLASTLDFDVDEYDSALQKAADVRKRLQVIKRNRFDSMYTDRDTSTIIDKIDDQYKETEIDPTIQTRRLKPSLEKKLHDDKYINQLDMEDIDTVYNDYFKPEYHKDNSGDDIIAKVIKRLRDAKKEAVITEATILRKANGQDKNKINELMRENDIDPEWLTNTIYLEDKLRKETYACQLSGWDTETNSVILSSVDKDNPLPKQFTTWGINNFKNILNTQDKYEKNRAKDNVMYGVTGKAHADTEVIEIRKEDVIDLIKLSVETLENTLEDQLYAAGNKYLASRKNPASDEELYRYLTKQKNKILHGIPLLSADKFIKKFEERDPTIDESNLVRKLIKLALGKDLGYIARKQNGKIHYYITSNHNTLGAVRDSELTRQTSTTDNALNNFKSYLN